jgi:uroporphyrinogen decarboxylase
MENIVNTLLIDALNKKNYNKSPPVWLMRQAGRYMPEYQSFRKKHTLRELFHQPELATQITLLPIQLLDVDAAILFSDILVLLEACGTTTDFKEGIGPVLSPAFDDPKQIETLAFNDIKTTLSYVFQTIKQVKSELKVPLIGFSGAPFTLASYLIEGGSSKTLHKTKKWIYTYPDLFKVLIKKITLAVIEYIKEQINSGVQVVQLFDTWANHLPPEEFQKYAVTPLKEIQSALPSSTPFIYFSLANSRYYKDIPSTALSLDSLSCLQQVRKDLPNTVLQGNLDPLVLLSTPSEIKKHVFKTLETMKGDPGFIFNLGHGIIPQTPLKNVQYLVEIIKSHSFT